MDDKDHFSHDEKVTPLFREQTRDVDDEVDDYIDLKPELDRNEEYAAESATFDHTEDEGIEEADEGSFGRGLGWLGFILSIIGLVFLPIVMGTAGVIIGFIAMRQGARVLGGWAIAIGLIALILRLFTGFFIF